MLPHCIVSSTPPNAGFFINGHANVVDHRSCERQGLDLIPTVHLGVAAHQMERRGIFNRYVRLRFAPSATINQSVINSCKYTLVRDELTPIREDNSPDLPIGLSVKY